MAVFKQPRDETQVRIYTPHYRIYGYVHLVPGRSTADLLNLEQRHIIPVTRANLFAPGWRHPPDKDDLRGRVHFMGLNRTKILWVVGGRSSAMTAATAKEVRVGLLYEDYLLSGQLWIPRGQRVSDHLHTSKPFQSVFGVKLYPLREGQRLADLEEQAEFEFVTVNTSEALAVIEG